MRSEKAKLQCHIRHSGENRNPDFRWLQLDSGLRRNDDADKAVGELAAFERQHTKRRPPGDVFRGNDRETVPGTWFT